MPNLYQRVLEYSLSIFLALTAYESLQFMYEIYRWRDKPGYDKLKVGKRDLESAMRDLESQTLE